jgi:capsular polysaccharide transport system permease protein
MRSVRGGFIQLQVIHALILRETRTRFGANQLGYLWAVVEPMLWIGTFIGLFTVSHRTVPAGMDLVGFLGTGVLTYELFSKNVGRLGEAVNGNRPLLFYPLVQPIDLALARAALETATLSTVFALVMLAAAFFDPNFSGIEDPLAVLIGLFLTASLGASMGLVFCMLSVFSNTVDRLRGPLMRPLFWTSGLFFTAADAPPEARELLLYNPVLHAVEMVRDGWFVSYSAPYTSVGYIGGWILGLALCGLLLERAARGKIELT